MMTPRKLIKTKLQDGVWHGVLKASQDPLPEIEVTYLNTQITDVEMHWQPEAGHWTLTIPIPRRAISDGVQVLLIRDARSGSMLGEITLLAGEPLSADIRVQIAELRAELDLLQRAFRRHCQETG